jgi:hypothetical protein
MENDERLDEKSMDLYGSPFYRIPESHQQRVRSEVAREDATAREDVSQDELEAVGEMYDQLVAGTFYEQQDAALKEMFGPQAGVKFIGG